MEDIEADYFYDPYLISFFTQGKISSDKIIYKMHDLIHDLARLVSTDTCFQVKTSHYPLFGNACHLALHYDNVRPIDLKATHKNERLRTFTVMCKNCGSGVVKLVKKLFYYLKFARVLDLSNIGLGEVPEPIDHLIYPRYLNNLSNLRHIVFDVGGKLSSMPQEFGKLTNLQTLTAFVVENRKGHRIEELKKMDSLRGSLSIKNIDNVTNAEDAKDSKLDMKLY
ncbi:hypothetical protein BUALT_Bualt12G0042200 [Buddleja alternifolia]|uniref:Uncharacterized protein n=1 Tax=Buddleja alternifolia TaxID=168488 RepID=A0AAV6WQ54_9LAMI|nr:hypothetical protein BUALT_Bualt12G0042200 [Buddleja alternifolia]